MELKSSYKAMKLAAGFTAISSALNPNIVFSDDDMFMMTDMARSYWVHGKAGEGLCGIRMKPDIEEMKEEAGKGNGMAAFRLGQLYEDGMWGAGKSNEEAIKWYKVAADQKVYNAIVNLGTIYEIGRGTPRDLQKAKYWFNEAQKIKYDPYLAEKLIWFKEETAK